MPVGRNEQVFTVLESKSRSRSLGIHLLYLNFRSLSMFQLVSMLVYVWMIYGSSIHFVGVALILTCSV